MDKLFYMAEKEMLVLHNPYVGTEHFFLAYLNEYGSKFISYEAFKKYVKEIIGCSYKQSEFVLYTPILRYVKNNYDNVRDAILYILGDEDSIVYNVLMVKNINIEDILKEIKNK